MTSGWSLKVRPLLEDAAVDAVEVGWTDAAGSEGVDIAGGAVT